MWLFEFLSLPLLIFCDGSTDACASLDEAAGDGDDVEGALSLVASGAESLLGVLVAPSPLGVFVAPLLLDALLAPLLLDAPLASSLLEALVLAAPPAGVDVAESPDELSLEAELLDESPWPACDVAECVLVGEALAELLGVDVADAELGKDDSRWLFAPPAYGTLVDVAGWLCAPPVCRPLEDEDSRSLFAPPAYGTLVDVGLLRLALFEWLGADCVTGRVVNSPPFRGRLEWWPGADSVTGSVVNSPPLSDDSAMAIPSFSASHCGVGHSRRWTGGRVWW